MRNAESISLAGPSEEDPAVIAARQLAAASAAREAAARRRRGSWGPTYEPVKAKRGVARLIVLVLLLLGVSAFAALRFGLLPY